jgi:hypothetical protein
MFNVAKQMPTVVMPEMPLERTQLDSGKSLKQE